MNFIPLAIRHDLCLNFCMLERSKKPKRPRDINVLASKIVERATEGKAAPAPNKKTSKAPAEKLTTKQEKPKV